MKKIITIKLTADQAQAINGALNLLMDNPSALATALAIVEKSVYKEKVGVHMLAAFGEFVEDIEIEVHKHNLCLDKDCPEKGKKITNKSKNYGREKRTWGEPNTFSWDQLKR
jgi:hypothetical protein